MQTMQDRADVMSDKQQGETICAILAEAGLRPSPEVIKTLIKIFADGGVASRTRMVGTTALSEKQAFQASSPLMTDEMLYELSFFGPGLHYLLHNQRTEAPAA